MLRTPIARTGSLKPARAKKCSICREKFVPRSAWAKACSPECAIAHTAAERKRLDANQTRERKQKVKTRGQHIADVQVAFNALVRYRDRNEVCISCQTVLSTLADQPGGGYDCGHYRSRGSAPHLRFDLRNAHGQCKKCNRYRAGNAADYRIGLITRFDLAFVEALECDQAGGGWTIPELLVLKEHFRAELKKLKETT